MMNLADDSSLPYLVLTVSTLSGNVLLIEPIVRTTYAHMAERAACEWSACEAGAALIIDNRNPDRPQIALYRDGCLEGAPLPIDRYSAVGAP